MDFLDFLLPMLIVVLLGVIGITFWLAWVIFSAKHKDKLEAPSQPAILSQVAQEPADPALVEIAHAKTGAWEILINGQSYRTLEAVPDDALRQEVVLGLKALVTFARSYVQKTQAPKKKPAAAAPPRERPQSPPVSAPPPVERPAPQLDAERARVFLRGEPRLNRPDAVPSLMPSLDLAGQIGEIVEEMQVRVPSLAGRSVRLQNAPGGGIQFAIDGIVYPDVESIPDLDVQALIRAATQEWERR